MSKLRSVNTHFWSDIYVIDLEPVDKLLFLYLLTNEHTNMLGVYELHINKVAFDTGNPLERVRKAFEGFEKDEKIAYKDGYVILKNFMKHQNLNLNMQKSAINSFNELPFTVRQHPFCQPLAKALKGFIKASQTLREYEVEYEYEVEGEIEDENARETSGDLLGEIADKPPTILNKRNEKEEAPLDRINECPVPEELQYPAFIEQYQRYIKYMKENFNIWPQSTTTEVDLHKLNKFRQAGQDPVLIIEQTIQARNKSFYDLKDFKSKTQNNGANNGTKGDKHSQFFNRNKGG